MFGFTGPSSAASGVVCGSVVLMAALCVCVCLFVCCGGGGVLVGVFLCCFAGDAVVLVLWWSCFGGSVLEVDLRLFSCRRLPAQTGSRQLWAASPV